MTKFNPQEYSDLELERITLRLPHKTKEEMATIAQNANISLNGYITRCIAYAMKMSA